MFLVYGYGNAAGSARRWLLVTEHGLAISTREPRFLYSFREKRFQIGNTEGDIVSRVFRCVYIYMYKWSFRDARFKKENFAIREKIKGNSLINLFDDSFR